MCILARVYIYLPLLQRDLRNTPIGMDGLCTLEASLISEGEERGATEKKSISVKVCEIEL